mmetsp:Transcript_14290/g.31080  ORF Transcript_14290/g.31080 Transcript_14290/m.31080 type:complete len:92 (-) Transcript_14290:1102-1377(-)
MFSKMCTDNKRDTEAWHMLLHHSVGLLWKSNLSTGHFRVTLIFFEECNAIINCNLSCIARDALMTVAIHLDCCSKKCVSAKFHCANESTPK